nr:Mu-like prophage major head subunit gpT family protein [uncultured Rhodopila sp.]
MQITFPALQSINDAVSLAYNTQFFETPTIYNRWTFDSPSTGRIQVYPRLNLLPGLREWLGDRVVNQLSTATFSITNKDWEETIGVFRNDIEDDQYGFITQAAQQLAMNARHLPDLLIAQLMLGGHTSITYDGQNFFDLAHPNPNNAAGTGGTTVANYQAGGGTPWYLFDTTKIVKPFIWQTRKPFLVIPKFSMTDPQVFWNKEFEWGVDGRANAGYGLWQLAFMSTAPMTIANVTAARTAMASIRRPDGTPMGIRPNLLVTGTALYPDARAYAENEFVPIDSVSGAATLAPNPLRGLFEAVENTWIN